MVTSPSSLAAALSTLADLMEARTEPLNHFGLAHLISRVIDGEDSSPYKPTSNSDLQAQMVKILAPDGFLGPVPTLTQVREAAAEAAASDGPYCTGDRCADCTPADECCEATCGCCPRVDEHGHCWLRSGSEDDSKKCDQHGEGWLYDRSPEAQLRYDILRGA